MDEATSGLDNESQARVQQIIETQLKGKSTVISVAHRLDTIKTYDHIAVMKGGEIVEMGGYDELIDKKGTLYKLVEGSG
jgi:ABC-type multidrug transport system fused ATPase/permease subunit